MLKSLKKQLKQRRQRKQQQKTRILSRRIRNKKEECQVEFSNGTIAWIPYEEVPDKSTGLFDFNKDTYQRKPWKSSDLAKLSAFIQIHGYDALKITEAMGNRTFNSIKTILSRYSSDKEFSKKIDNFQSAYKEDDNEEEEKEAVIIISSDEEDSSIFYEENSSDEENSFMRDEESSFVFDEEEESSFVYDEED